MGKEEKLNSGNQWYNYSCPSCDYKTEVEDIVVDAFFYSQGCKKGVYPTLTCPKCHGRMKCMGERTDD